MKTVRSMSGSNFSIVAKSAHFTHPDAHWISRAALQVPKNQKVVVIDLSRVRSATTSAFARLVILRRELLSRGRDLQLVGMHDRVETLYELNRLDSVLPRA